MEKRPSDGTITWSEVPMLLDELREMARRLLWRWPGMHSLQPSMVVSDALLKQRRKRPEQPWGEVTWESRRHFFGQVGRAMRQVLVEYWRHQRTHRYWAMRRMPVEELELYQNWRGWLGDEGQARALALLLERLETDDPELAEVVHLRFFVGLTWPEMAEMVGVSRSTLERRWQRVRILLRGALCELEAEGAGGNAECPPVH